jgi:hypothetical protein
MLHIAYHIKINCLFGSQHFSPHQLTVTQGELVLDTAHQEGRSGVRRLAAEEPAGDLDDLGGTLAHHRRPHGVQDARGPRPLRPAGHVLLDLLPHAGGRLGLRGGHPHGVRPVLELAHDLRDGQRKRGGRLSAVRRSPQYKRRHTLGHRSMVLTERGRAVWRGLGPCAGAPTREDVRVHSRQGNPHRRCSLTESRWCGLDCSGAAERRGVQGGDVR